ncbi:MAG: T9SS type A sorting domain-containing protein [Bacteroidota bacterium]
MNRIVFIICLISFSNLPVEGRAVQEAVLDAEIFYSWDNKLNKWIPGDRTTYRYDSVGNAIESAMYTWNEDGGQGFWNGLRRYLYGLDSLGNVESEKGFSWDELSGDWSPGGQVCSEEASECEELPALLTTRRDTSGEIIAEEMYRWNAMDQQFVMYQRTTLSMDDQGRYIEYSAMELDTAGDTWIVTFHAELFYDSLGNRSGIERYSWNPTSEALLPVDSILLSYDSLGNQTEQLIYVPEDNTGQWVPSEWYQMEYDGMGNQVMVADYLWDAGIPGWGLSFRLVYTYDSLGNNTEYIYYVIDGISGREGPDWRSVNTWDSAGNLVESTGYYWNPRIAYWSRYSRETASYDSTGYNTASMSYSWDNNINDWKTDAGNRKERIFDSRGNVVEETSLYWDTRQNGWINEWRMESYWSTDLLREQTFYMEENMPEGSDLGPIIIGSAYQGEEIVLSLDPGSDGLSGSDGLFVIDTIPGGFNLLQTAPLDFEAQQVRYLSVAGRMENGGETVRDTAVFSVFVRNVNDNAPMVRDTSFSVAEDLAGAKNLGKVPFADADGDLDLMKYSIVSGNNQEIFRVAYTGSVILQRYDSIDYEKQVTYQLTIRVSDGLFFDEGTVTVLILDVEEPLAVVPAVAEDFRLYPNPASETVRLSCPDGEYAVAITSANGTLLRRWKFSGATELMDISTFRAGIYFLTIASEEQVVTKKMIRF